MPDYQPTNAASSGVKLDKKTLKTIAARSDRPGVIWLAQWTVALIVTGSLVWILIGSPWVWPAMMLHGIFLSVPAYSASHETAHGTAFRTRWLNEAVLWVTSLIYMEEPLHRRYTHTNHHTHTWHVGKDSQMPFDTPMGFGGWLAEITGFALLRFHLQVFWHLSIGHYTDTMRMVTPEQEFPKMTRNARIMVAIYLVVLLAPAVGIWWPLWLIVLPRILGAPIMLLFTLIQHVELQENSPSILESTRSFRTGPLAAFLYMNMNNHVEHHLYPQVPFHALPQLAEAVKDQVPAPDNGFFRSNWEVAVVVLRRSIGLSTKAPTLRQAPHMITEGGPVKRIAQRTM
ncbi:fatty acid desaturase [Mameliella sediminis]|uniref:fatty acid desaturase n=1 Tax=Mameliella sediminis TaxID=2836866 RepID=UPI001C43CEFA|nr:fatty acid desaturase [Mameliella sediminis]MBY6113207.1 fatty acid desaturase [Antarctobacter heliothermus]MBY6143445.1 fatty acid desaturase [Mameliella alba]MBV7394490.1 fatty acid desaturase [Mameliella sediminis]MBY6162525.1 fatty acid desaturase [Mameliella alba]MBY6171884.1 fatty acid desaturase [Mameliella alba]